MEGETKEQFDRRQKKPAELSFCVRLCKSCKRESTQKTEAKNGTMKATASAQLFSKRHGHKRDQIGWEWSAPWSDLAKCSSPRVHPKRQRAQRTFGKQISNEMGEQMQLRKQGKQKGKRKRKTQILQGHRLRWRLFLTRFETGGRLDVQSGPAQHSI